MAENENNNAMLEALDSIKTVNVGDVVKGRALKKMKKMAENEEF